MVGHHVQQQQQHSLFCQASWGRLEMKPKRNKGHGSGTLIASLNRNEKQIRISQVSYLCDVIH